MPAYVLFLIANAMLFVRPGELVPALGNLQLYLLAITGAMVFAIQDMYNQLRLRTMLQQPVNLCILGVTLAVLVSRVTTGKLIGADTAFIGMVKILVYYLLLVSVINTPERLRTFLMSTAICSTLMIAWSVKDYHDFLDEWVGRPDLLETIYSENGKDPSERTLMRHIPDRTGTLTEYGEEVFFFRLCGLGIFHDPNDLSLLIVATSVISLFFLTDPRLDHRRVLWVIPLIVMAVAMHYTYSRGGLLAAGVGLFAWLAVRYGKKTAIAIGLLGALAVPVALGRAGNIDVSEGTGQQRVRLWSDGLMAIRNGRILFGTGEGTYYEIAGHVAHNSYVHSFVELGFVGGTLFFGCFFMPAYTFFLMKKFGFQITHPELRRLFPYVAAVLAEWSMGMCSLSRCYTPSTYMVAGLCASFVNLVGFYRPSPRPLIVLNANVAKAWATCSAGLLFGAYVFVRLFARWG